MSSVYILHENQEWISRLTTALDELKVPFSDWFLDKGSLPLSVRPPEGVFYNRMSASSHFRDHRFGPELTHIYLNWLAQHERRVVNGWRALYLEVSKVAQYTALRRHGIQVPRTDAVVGRDALWAAASSFGPGQFLIKPNRGGSGKQIRMISGVQDLESFIESEDYREPLDGIWLLQEYIRPASGRITRCEFVGGEFLYAVSVDATQGFELCPDQGCGKEGKVGPIPSASTNLFTILPDFHHEVIPKYLEVLRANDIGIGALEFVESDNGEVYTYDLNTNTNYNEEAEARAGLALTAPQAIARYLESELGRKAA